jgi:hypothetical protein
MYRFNPPDFLKSNIRAVSLGRIVCQAIAGKFRQAENHRSPSGG